MAFLYHVITCNALPATKRTFACRCEAIKHFKGILKDHGKGVAKEDLLPSIRMYRIDDDVMKNRGKLYPEKAS